MHDYAASINQQYGRVGLNSRILTAFESEGTEIDKLTLDDLSRFDQLHPGGRDATRMLAQLADLIPGMEVLDIGCGVGGPARTLAAEFGCQVIGIDITIEYVTAAQMLTDKVGLSGSVSFREGNALDLEFEDQTFDVIWTQNAIMNIEDKERVFQEVFRTLRKGGLLALESLMADAREESRFPVFWADNPNLSFMITPESFRQMMSDIGFEELIWEDATKQAIDRAHKQQAAAGNTPPPVGLQLLYTDVPQKAENTLKGFEDGTYLDIYAVFKRVS